MKARIIIVIIIIMSVTYGLKAQEYKIPVENTSNCVLSLQGFGGELVIEGYSGNEVIIKTDDKVEIPERAKDLKPVYQGGTDNSGLGLNVQNKNNQIEITCLLPLTKERDYNLKVPENLIIKIENSCYHTDDIIIAKMRNEIEIKACHDIVLIEVSGPLVLSTVSGDVDITFDKINSAKPFSISSISGEIDVTLPPDLKADLDIRSITGMIYSNFDLVEKDKEFKEVESTNIYHKLNGGGSKFTIVNVSGNIYLRKGK